jgi:hypothetical protein
MGRMLLMYVLGFGGVWAAVALSWTALAGYRRFDRNWDRAFIKELRPELEEVGHRSRPATDGHRAWSVNPRRCLTDALEGAGKSRAKNDSLSIGARPAGCDPHRSEPCKNWPKRRQGGGALGSRRQGGGALGSRR